MHIFEFLALDTYWHGLQTPGEEISFTARPKINSHSQIFRYGRGIFCLPHRPKFLHINIQVLYFDKKKVLHNLNLLVWVKFQLAWLKMTHLSIGFGPKPNKWFRSLTIPQKDSFHIKRGALEALHIFNC